MLSGLFSKSRTNTQKKPAWFSRLSFILIGAVSAGAMLLASCSPNPAALASPQVPVTGPTGAAGNSISLRLAVSDDTGTPSEPYVREFVSQVSSLSAGAITILPSWNASPDNFEQGVIKAVLAGQFDLGLAASRAWDTASVNITSFQALQAPFLINNDALALAVATSDAATQMLANLSTSGAVGLTMWPEDLRHPFSLVPGKSLLSPADFSGLSIRVTPSAVSNMIIEKLGGTPMFADSGYQGAESGLRQGSSLSGAATATGNVTFYAKFQVLFANGAAFKALSAAQQAFLRQAADATQKKAIAEHPSDAQAATAYCADGGKVVLTSADQVAAFEKAAQPVFDYIDKDPANAKLIAALQDLKSKTTASTGAAACGSSAAQINPAPTAANQVWSAGTLPNGVWKVKLSVDELFQAGDLRSVASDWAGTYTVPFQDGKFQILYQGDQGQTGKCQGTYAVVGDVVRLTYLQVTTAADECPGEVDDLQWRLDDQGLHIHLASAQNVNFGEDKAFWEAKPWQSVK
jgi:TRAP-type C4-dicarboxylate transport system substrate-binding protein